MDFFEFIDTIINAGRNVVRAAAEKCENRDNEKAYHFLFKKRMKAHGAIIGLRALVKL